MAHYSGITATAPPPQQQTAVPSQTLQFAPHTNQFRQLQVQIPPPGVFLQHQQQRVPQLDSLQSTPSAQQNRQPYQSELLHALTPVQPSPRVQRPASTVPTSVYPRNQDAALRNSSPTQFAFSPSSLRRHSMYEPSTNTSYMSGQITPIAEHALPGAMLEYTYEPSPSYSLNGALDYAYSSGNNSAPTTARTTSSSATLASPPLGASLSPTAVQTSTPKSFSAEDEHRIQLGTVAGQDMMVDLGTQDLYHSPTEMNLKPAAVITIPTAMDVDSKDGVISIPPAEVYNDPPSLSTRSKRRSSVPTGPAPKRARSIPTVDNRPIASGSAAPLVVKSDPGNSPPIDEADDDDDWQAPRVGQSRSRPRPHRTGSGSSSRSQKDANSKNPMTRNLKSNADLVGLAKLNDVQRRHVLMADPLSGNVEPTRVFCTSCNKWVKLGEGVKYRIRHWVGHVVLVHKRPREESDQIQAQGIVNANTDSGPTHAIAPKLPTGRKGRTRDGSESDEEQPLAVLSRRRKSQSEGIAPVDDAAAEAGSSLPSAVREDSPLTPVSSPTAPPATVITKNGNFLNNVSATKTMRSRAHADGESVNANKTPAREYAGNDSNRPWSSGGS